MGMVDQVIRTAPLEAEGDARLERIRAVLARTADRDDPLSVDEALEAIQAVLDGPEPARPRRESGTYQKLWG
jgi:hypothetical protein